MWALTISFAFSIISKDKAKKIYSGRIDVELKHFITKQELIFTLFVGTFGLVTFEQICNELNIQKIPGIMSFITFTVWGFKALH